MKTKKDNRINELVERQIRHVDQLLEEGSPLGGQSLTSLIQMYKEHGPFHPARNGLIRHLHRCLEEMTTLDGYIVARAHALPDKELDRAYKTFFRKRDKEKSRGNRKSQRT